MALGQRKRVSPVLVGENANTTVFDNYQQVNAIGPNGIYNATSKIVQVLGYEDTVP
jgi:hypothetical protein